MDAADTDEMDWPPDAYGPLDSPSSKNPVHKHIMFDNPWKVGRALLEKRDVLRVREEAQRRRKQKSEVRKCILRGIQASHLRRNARPERVEVLGLSPWQKHTRSVPNNLGL